MNTSTANIELLSPNVREKIAHWLKKYPPAQKQSGVLYALRLVQEQNGGWLTVELMDAVAAYLEMPPIAVYEAATFYNMYHLKPAGQHTLSVCTNISCMLRGAEKIVEHLQQRLGIQVGETTSDGLFMLKEVECLAACGGAPVLQVDDRHYHEAITPEKVDALLAELERGN